MESTETELVPYFHPTQIVLVDDDINFLGNLSLQLGADLAYLLFDSTTKALSYINNYDRRAPTRKRFFSLLDMDRHQTLKNKRVRVSLDTNALLKELHFTNRFSQISVAMVDYAMPHMNGIEFCERIHNTNIKKILFTGVATEAEAVDAFNRGVIDCYIRKSERHVYDHLNCSIRQFQYDYIRDTFAAANDVFEVDKPDWLSDPVILALMRKLKTRYGIVEYYLALQPEAEGFILVDGNGLAYRFVLWGESDRTACMAHARLRDAPEVCLEALKGGKLMLAPAIREGTSADQFEKYRHWQDYAITPSRLQGRRDYSWAVFESALATSDVKPPAESYYRYLEWLDTVGYSLM